MTSPSSPAVEQQVRCWCGNTHLDEFSPDYFHCPDCETLVLRAMRGEEISQVRNDDEDFYGKSYYQQHLQEDYGYPDLETRARADLPERCLHWLRTVLQFVPGNGARTLELGCGHGGFVAIQRWAGLDATGLELSPWLVSQARDWFEVPIIEGQLENQQLGERSWDAVIMMDVLEHLPDPKKTLTQAITLLKPDTGFLLVQTPRYPVGCSYQAMRETNHPFLFQLKPLEHLYLFSEKSLSRLCHEIGLPEVRFEPAIFAHYDMFALASKSALQERSLPQQAESLLSASPPARAALALLDLGEARDRLSSQLADLSAENEGVRQSAENLHGEVTRLHGVTAELYPRLNALENERNLLIAQLAEFQRQFDGVQSDNAARLLVIEQQGAETSRLHGEVHRWLQQAGELGPKLGEVKNERNLLAAQLAESRRQFECVAADNAARLAVIEQQGAEVSHLHSEVDRWLRQASDLGPRVEQMRHDCNLLRAQSAELQQHFEGSEADRAARLEVIQLQGAQISHLHEELGRVSERSNQLDSRVAEMTQEREVSLAAEAKLNAHWTVKSLKALKLWPF